MLKSSSFFLAAIFILLFSSCNPMKKNVSKDTADDILEMIISKSGDENFLVSKEEVFQATSKSDNNGIRQITGYTEYRITSYDLNTGNISKRIVLGDRKENECSFLGYTNGKLWYKSVDPKLGFHARDPKTLDVIVTQDRIIEVNPFLNGNISQPEWNNIRTYYGFDIDKNMPMISDNSGYVYFIDTETLKAEKTTESVRNFKFDNNCLTTSIKTNADKTVYLTGSPRCFINMNSKDIKEPNFLKGQFLQSSNVMNVEDSNPAFFLPFKKEIEKITNEIDSINQFIKDADTTSGDKYIQQNVKRNLIYAVRNVEYARTKIENIKKKMGKSRDNDSYEIITEDNSIFILSQTDVTDQAKIIISKVKLNSDTSVTQQWQTVLNDFYRDPDKGFDKSSFEVVFSKGDPDLRTMRVVRGNNKLIFAFMLKAACLDINTGNVIWVRDL